MLGVLAGAAQLSLNYGNAANDGTGEGLRTLFSKIQTNFNELYSLAYWVQTNAHLTNATLQGQTIFGNGSANINNGTLTTSGATIGATSSFSGAVDFGSSGTLAGISVNGNVLINNAGGGLSIREGANAKMGTNQLNGTTAVTIANTGVQSGARVFLTIQSPAGTVGTPYVSAINPSVSFAMKSTSATDTSVVAWLLINAP